MNILITGVAGFIGFSFAKQLLKKNKFNIIGIDNFEDYYDVNLKKKRMAWNKSVYLYKFLRSILETKESNLNMVITT